MGRKRKREEGLIFDIAYEILLRLPVKTLVRFQCVSKSWHSLITDPIFRQSHYSRLQTSPLLLVTGKDFVEDMDTDMGVTKSSRIRFSVNNQEGTCIKRFSKTVDPQNCRHRPFQSCQGLVCLGSKSPKYNNLVLICNPSTEELIALPPAREAHHSMVGFGYAPSTKEFKVVRYSGHKLDDLHDFCEVFTLGTSKWREARNPPPRGFYFRWNSLFFRGALHLLPDPYYADEDGCMDCIYAFDIESENYTTIPIPDYYRTVDGSNMVEYLQELGGSLCLNFDFKTRMEIWCLKDYGGKQWAKEYTINFSSLVSACCADALAVIGDGRMLLNIDVKGEQALYYYNFKDASFTQITILNATATIYVESLLPIGSGLFRID